jgi:HPt (histidine-containing phosphotransfer) domain-containing protein
MLGGILEKDPDSAAVLLDREVAALARQYVLGLPEKVVELRRKLAVADWTPFSAAVHKLVGTVGTYRLDEIYRVAEELERMAEKEDVHGAAALLDALGAAVDRTVAELS